MLRNELTKPTDSEIEVFDGAEGRTYRWNQPRGCLVRMLLTTFLLIWLVGLTVGFALSTDAMLQDDSEQTTGFWALWCGGSALLWCLALLALFLVLRPAHPECLTLTSDSLYHDSGTPRLPGTSRHHEPDQVVGRFKRRTRTRVSRQELQPVKLERIRPPSYFALLKRYSLSDLFRPQKPSQAKRRQSLQLCCDRVRIEIGESLSEPDREWLAAIIEEWRTEQNMETH